MSKQAVKFGGTGQTTTTSAFNNISPVTTTGDLIYGSASSINSRLAIGSTGQVLTVVGGIPAWATPSSSGTSSFSSIGILNQGARIKPATQVASTSGAAITFTSANAAFDQGNFIGTNQITIPVAGLYLLSANALYASASSQATDYLYIGYKKNGGAAVNFAYCTGASGAQQFFADGSIADNFAAGDVITFVTTSVAGANISGINLEISQLANEQGAGSTAYINKGVRILVPSQATNFSNMTFTSGNATYDQNSFSTTANKITFVKGGLYLINAVVQYSGTGQTNDFLYLGYTINGAGGKNIAAGTGGPVANPIISGSVVYNATPGDFLQVFAGSQVAGTINPSYLTVTELQPGSGSNGSGTNLGVFVNPATQATSTSLGTITFTSANAAFDQSSFSATANQITVQNSGLHFLSISAQYNIFTGSNQITTTWMKLFYTVNGGTAIPLGSCYGANTVANMYAAGSAIDYFNAGDVIRFQQQSEANRGSALQQTYISFGEVSGAPNVAVNASTGLFTTSVTTPSHIITGASTGTLTHQYPSTASSATLTWPAGNSTGNQLLQNNGSGTLSWVTVTPGSSSGVSGAVQFSGGSGAFSADDATFHWDNTNKRLGILTNTPNFMLDLSNWTSVSGAHSIALGSNAGTATPRTTSVGIAGPNPSFSHPAYTGQGASINQNDTAICFTTKNSSGDGQIDLYTFNSAGNTRSRLSIATDGTATWDKYQSAGVALFDAAGVMSSLASGTSGNFLKSNGTTWVSSALPVPTKQVFTSGSGTYTLPSGCKWIRVRALGGGGAGGGSNGGVAAGGGGAGGYTEEIITSPSGTYAYAVGAGGTVNANGAGGTGGNTTFGSSFLVANGGVGGDGGNGSGAVNGGSGGTASGSTTLNVQGNPGSSAFGATLAAAEDIGGQGAGGPWGGGGKSPITNNSDGVAATGYGGGGSGSGGSSGAARNGGAGFGGIIIVEEYY